MSQNLHSNGVTVVSGTVKGSWSPYLGGSSSPAGGSGGAYADQGASPSYEFVYITPTAAQLNPGYYTVEGLSVLPPAGQTFSSAGYDSLGFSAQVNPE